YALKFNNYNEVKNLIRDLGNLPEIEYAEKAPLYHINLVPNDVEYGSSTHHNWFLSVINAEQAWNIEQGNSNIKVAIVDNGIYVGHPDLQNKIVAQYDVADNDNDPTPPTQDTEWSHGTHTSGLVGAETNNSIGIASIGFGVSLMAVKVAENSSDGSGVTYGYEGITWAADNGADVINLSWGGPGYYQTGQNIMNYAYNKGCVIVASAGNDGNTTISYPAAYNHVISVASTDYNDSKSYFSQYGSTIDVCAPGGFDGSWYSIYSTVYTSSQYDYMQGTSMSSPVCAGLCGLMLSHDPSLTPEKLETILKATCDNIDAQNSSYIGQIGAGRINAYAALNAVEDTLNANSIIADFEASSVTIPVSSSVNFTDLSSGTPTSWSWIFEGGTPSTSTQQNPTNIVYNNPGSFQVTLTISDGTNSNIEIKTNFIVVNPLVSGAWMPQATGFTTPSRGINYISIVDPDIVWANAYDGSGTGADIWEFTKTTDGGSTWTPGTYAAVPSNYVVSTISAISDQKAWIAMYDKNASSGYGGIFATADGGTTWNEQTTATYNDPASFPNIVYFWDANNGFCQGDPTSSYFEIYTTTNGGTNWVRTPQANIPVPLSGEYGYTDLYDTYGNTVWFGTNKGRVFKSTDKGLNWTVSTTGSTEVSTLGFHNDSIGIMTYVVYNQTSGTITSFEMRRSVDGGATWNLVSPTGDYYKSDMATVKDAQGMLVSTGSSQDITQCGSAYSLDEGDTWTMLDDSIQYTTVKFYNNSTGWAGGFNQNSTTEGIWKWLGIPTNTQNVSEKESVMNIYPNPSNGYVNIFVPRTKDIFSIQIFNTLGKMVYSDNTRNGSSSQYKLFNLSFLPKGIYIVAIKSDNQISKQKIVIQ
ncbi:MAG: S8 family serine peptidase, partial [Bacteroidales bacterium]|nr:S8 family serine peptidase [Bacteroidales bacterium]